MRVKKILYHLFESDWSDIKNHINKLPHIIDRELELVLNNGNSLHISWSNKPIAYSIGVSSEMWFGATGEDSLTIDVSRWIIWKKFIDKEVKLFYLDKYNQALCLKSKENSIYFYSYENNNWLVDVLYIDNNYFIYSDDFKECISWKTGRQV